MIATSLLVCGALLVFAYVDLRLRLPKEEGIEPSAFWHFYFKFAGRQSRGWFIRACVAWACICAFAVLAQSLEWGGLFFAIFQTPWGNQVLQLLPLWAAMPLFAVPCTLLLAFRWSSLCWQHMEEPKHTTYIDFPEQPVAVAQEKGFKRLHWLGGVCIRALRAYTQSWHDRTTRLIWAEYDSAVLCFSWRESRGKPREVIHFQRREHQRLRRMMSDKHPAMEDKRFLAWAKAVSRAQRALDKNEADLASGETRAEDMARTLVRAWYRGVRYAGIRHFTRGELRLKPRLELDTPLACQLSSRGQTLQAEVHNLSEGYVALQVAVEVPLVVSDEGVDLRFAQIPESLQAYLPVASCQARIQRAEPSSTDSRQKVVLSLEP